MSQKDLKEIELKNLMSPYVTLCHRVNRFVLKRKLGVASTSSWLLKMTLYPSPPPPPHTPSPPPPFSLHLHLCDDPARE